MLELRKSFNCVPQDYNWESLSLLLGKSQGNRHLQHCFPGWMSQERVLNTAVSNNASQALYTHYCNQLYKVGPMLPLIL